MEIIGSPSSKVGSTSNWSGQPKKFDHPNNLLYSLKQSYLNA